MSSCFRILFSSFLVLAATLLSAADVTLSVGASSPSGKTLTYTWSLVTKPTGAIDPAIVQTGPASTIAGVTDTAIATFANGAVAGDYTFRAIVSDGTLSATSDTVVTIMKTQTITFNALPVKTAQDADFDPGAVSTSGLGISYASSNTAVATILNGKIHIVGTGATTITAKQSGNSTFTAASDVTQQLTVNAATQSITFAALPNKTIGDADFAPGATASSFLPVTYSSSNTSVATISAAGLIHVLSAGITTITASQSGSATFASTSTSQLLNVLKKAQTISFAGLPTTVQFGDADIVPGATATSGLAVTYTSSNLAVATIVGGKIHVVGSGLATITASQPGNATFAAATAVSQTLSVGAGQPPVITIPASATPATLVLP